VGNRFHRKIDSASHVGLDKPVRTAAFLSLVMVYVILVVLILALNIDSACIVEPIRMQHYQIPM
jgi:hypothetical protein